MEWSTEISWAPEREARWHVHKGRCFLHFNACAAPAFLSRSRGASREYYFLTSFKRKAAHLGKHVDYDSLEFALNNMRFFNYDKPPSQLLSVDLHLNDTKHPFGADVVRFNTLLLFDRRLHPSRLRGSLEAKMYPGATKMYFGEARCFFD